MKKENLRIMSKQYAHLKHVAKTSVKFQNDWPKTAGGVGLTSQLLMKGRTYDGRVTARLYRTCVSTQVRQKQDVFVKHKHDTSLGQGQFFFKVGHRSRSRSQVKIFCMSWKPLSQGTYMPNMKALSETVQKL